MLLKGFLRDVVQPIEMITLSVLAGKASNTAAMMTDFLVVKASLLYNAIRGRPTLDNLKAVTLTYHLKMKSSTDVGEVWGGQV